MQDLVIESPSLPPPPPINFQPAAPAVAHARRRRECSSTSPCRSDTAARPRPRALADFARIRSTGYVRALSARRQGPDRPAAGVLSGRYRTVLSVALTVPSGVEGDEDVICAEFGDHLDSISEDSERRGVRRSGLVICRRAGARCTAPIASRNALARSSKPFTTSNLRLLSGSSSATFTTSTSSRVSSRTTRSTSAT